MPFGLNKQTLTIAPRPGGAVPPFWVDMVETALLGRAQIERTEEGLELTLFGRPEVVAERVCAALTSALGEGWEPSLEVRAAGEAPAPPRRKSLTSTRY
ncbi:MAG TPA: hypothetical protein VN606_13515 [Thermoleophilaceae bacterium]|jgi:hypothetical protein|nr:hypothetical protein [Thermoleophilaceae bacterium]